MSVCVEVCARAMTEARGVMLLSLLELRLRGSPRLARLVRGWCLLSMRRACVFVCVRVPLNVSLSLLLTSSFRAAFRVNTGAGMVQHTRYGALQHSPRSLLSFFLLLILAHATRSSSLGLST